MAFINQELAQVPGCHVGWDLHHFAHAVFTEDLHNLCREKQNNLQLYQTEIIVRLSSILKNMTEKWQAS